jgi:hypothetical protein
VGKENIVVGFGKKAVRRRKKAEWTWFVIK